MAAVDANANTRREEVYSPDRFCCFICNCNANEIVKQETANTNDSEENPEDKSRRFHVIFLLRNIFELPRWKLEEYLREEANPEEWIKVCDSCDAAVRQAKLVYEEILTARRKFHDFKKALMETVMKGQQSSIKKKRKQQHEKSRSEVLQNRDFMEAKSSVTDDVREFISANNSEDLTEDSFISEDFEARLGYDMKDEYFGDFPLDTENVRRILDVTSEADLVDSSGNEVREPQQMKCTSHPQVKQEGVDSTLEDENDTWGLPEEKSGESKEKMSVLSASENDFDFDGPPAKKMKKDKQKKVTPTPIKKGRGRPSMLHQEKVKERKTKGRDGGRLKKYEYNTSPGISLEKIEIKNYVTCALCEVQKYWGMNRFDRYIRHLENDYCREQTEGEKDILKCPKCNKFRCNRKEAVQFVEHLGWCTGSLSKNKLVLVDGIPLNCRIFTCNVCLQQQSTIPVYFRLDGFLLHYVQHTVKPFQCTKCHLRFASVTNISGHWKDQHKNDGYKSTSTHHRYIKDDRRPEVPWWCSKCPRTFPDDVQMHTHLNKAHPDITGMGELKKCTWCEKQFLGDDERRLHEGTCHVTEKIGVECDICREIFQKMGHLKEHRQKVHNVDFFICDYDQCGAKFPSEFQLVKHQKLHEGDNRIDDENEKEHSSQNNYPRPHTSVKAGNPFLCSQCGAKFSRKESLTAHITQRHTDLENNALACPHCQKTFSSNANRRLHIETVHEKNYRFSCHLCPRQFATNTHLKKHLALSHEEGDYGKRICTICGQVFFRKVKYDAHMHKHAGNFQFFCRYCGKGFYLKDCWQKHENTTQCKKRSMATSHVASKIKQEQEQSATAVSTPESNEWQSASVVSTSRSNDWQSGGEML